MLRIKNALSCEQHAERMFGSRLPVDILSCQPLDHPQHPAVPVQPVREKKPKAQPTHLPLRLKRWTELLRFKLPTALQGNATANRSM